MVATTIYETENCGGDNITPGEDVSRFDVSDFGRGGVGCVGVRQTLMCQGPRASLIHPCFDREKTSVVSKIPFLFLRKTNFTIML